MKKNLLTALTALALIGTMTITTGCGKTAEAAETETRTIEGILTESYSIAEDRLGMNLVTYDGNHWKIADFTSNFYTPCEVTFDTKGTAEIEDDEIIQITTFTDFTSKRWSE